LDVVEALRVVQAVLYVGLAVAATRIWRRDRGRPAAYLAAAFVALGTATALGFVLRRVDPDDLQYLRDLNSVLVLAFPWLLAAFAWSFTHRRLPRWLQAAGVVQGALAVVVLLLPPLGEAGDRTTAAAVFVLVAVAVWVALVVAAAVPLWRGGRSRHRVVRIRTRAMAAGAVTLGFVLIASVRPAPDGHDRARARRGDRSGAAILFGIGYVPPRAAAVVVAAAARRTHPGHADRADRRVDPRGRRRPRWRRPSPRCTAAARSSSSRPAGCSPPPGSTRTGSRRSPSASAAARTTPASTASRWRATASRSAPPLRPVVRRLGT
jgi:drug/metabolite transporter (DMT)-like permease